MEFYKKETDYLLLEEIGKRLTELEEKKRNTREEFEEKRDSFFLKVRAINTNPINSLEEDFNNCMKNLSNCLSQVGYRDLNSDQGEEMINIGDEFLKKYKVPLEKSVITPDEIEFRELYEKHQDLQYFDTWTNIFKKRVNELGNNPETWRLMNSLGEILNDGEKSDKVPLRELMIDLMSKGKTWENDKCKQKFQGLKRSRRIEFNKIKKELIKKNPGGVDGIMNFVIEELGRENFIRKMYAVNKSLPTEEARKMHTQEKWDNKSARQKLEYLRYVNKQDELFNPNSFILYKNKEITHSSSNKRERFKAPRVLFSSRRTNNTLKESTLSLSSVFKSLLASMGIHSNQKKGKKSEEQSTLSRPKTKTHRSTLASGCDANQEKDLHSLVGDKSGEQPAPSKPKYKTLLSILASDRTDAPGQKLGSDIDFDSFDKAHNDHLKVGNTKSKNIARLKKEVQQESKLPKNNNGSDAGNIQASRSKIRRSGSRPG